MADSHSYDVNIRSDGRILNGFVARPLAEGTYPGILVGHEWAGLADFPKEIAIRLARQGFVTFIVDLFDGRLGRNIEESKALSGSISDSEAVAKYRAGLAFLKGLDAVRGDRVGAIGFCMSGRHMYLMSSQAPELKATAIFYGKPVPDTLNKINCPLLLVFGEADASISREEVEAVRKAAQAQNKTFELYTYPGAQHAFGNETNPDRYHAKAWADVWPKAIAFFNKYLKS